MKAGKNFQSGKIADGEWKRTGEEPREDEIGGRVWRRPRRGHDQIVSRCKPGVPRDQASISLVSNPPATLIHPPTAFLVDHSHHLFAAGTGRQEDALSARIHRQ